LGSDNILVKLWFKVVLSVFSSIMILGSRFICSHDQFMFDLLFSDIETIGSTNYVIILTKIRDKVISWDHSGVSFWVIVLNTSSSGANWIRIEINTLIKLLIKLKSTCVDVDCPIMVKILRGKGFIGNRGHDFVIHAEVWDEIVSWMWLWLLQVVSSPFVIKLNFSVDNMLLSGNNLFVHSEVWDKIISWNFFCFLFNCKLMVMLNFSLSNIKIGHLDVVIDSEVWYEVFSWWDNWFIESSIELCADLSLSFSEIGSSNKDIISIVTEVWDEIVDWPCWFLPSRTKWLLVPWSRSFGWSIRTFDSLSIL